MKFIIAALAATSLIATPVSAATNDNFTGIRAEVTAGLNDLTKTPDTNDVVYGAAAGFDAPVGDRFTIGIEGNASNVFEDERTLGAAARVGYTITPNVLGYVRGGYTNYENVFSKSLDGAVVGGGLQVAVLPNTYVKAEYNYSDFESNVGSHAGLVGIGFKF